MKHKKARAKLRKSSLQSLDLMHRYVRSRIDDARALTEAHIKVCQSALADEEYDHKELCADAMHLYHLGMKTWLNSYVLPIVNIGGFKHDDDDDDDDDCDEPGGK
jgi:hypothetical protein